MMRTQLCLVVCLVICLVITHSPAVAQRTVTVGNIEWGGNSSGLTALKYKGYDALANGQVRPFGQVKFIDDSGAITAQNWGKVTGSRLDGATIETDYEWGGRVATSYAVKNDALQIDVTVENRTGKTVKEFYLSLLTLRFPSAPARWDPHGMYLRSNIGQPGYIAARCESHQVVVVNPDVVRPLLHGFIYSEDRKPESPRQLIIGTGGKGHLGGRLDPLIQRHLAAETTDSFLLSLRFAPTEQPIENVIGDVAEAYARKNPMFLKWDDRRPIGTVFLARDNAKWPKNPRGWFNDESLDVTTDAGRRVFRDRLLQYADNTVANLKKMNAQGVIIWDIEGAEHPHPITYFGDPRRLAPEMEPVADEFFKRIRDAGFRVGVCLRPQQLTPKDGGGLSQSEVDDPAVLLKEKLQYAKDRWGATLFYVDSNGDPNVPLPVEVFRSVAEAFPDTLILPENETVGYHAVTAPYGDAKAGDIGGASGLARAMYPNAIRAIYAADANIEKDGKRLIETIKGGNILLFRAWFDDPQNAKLLELYQTANRP